MLCFKLEKSFFIVVEIVSFLYATLMSTANAQSSNPTLPDGTINLVTDALCMLNFMATVDLNVLQVGGGRFQICTCIGKAVEAMPNRRNCFCCCESFGGAAPLPKLCSG